MRNHIDKSLLTTAIEVYADIVGTQISEAVEWRGTDGQTFSD